MVSMGNYHLAQLTANDQTILLFDVKVSVFITKKISYSLACGIGVCDVLKIKPLFREFLSRGFYHFFSTGYQRREYLPIFTENVVYTAYKTRRLAVAFVVVGVAAPVVAEFLINPALYRLAAIQAIGLMRGVCHKFSILTMNGLQYPLLEFIQWKTPGEVFLPKYIQDYPFLITYKRQ